MILLLISFLVIFSVWSDILQEEGNCTQEKNIAKIQVEIQDFAIQLHCIFSAKVFFLYNSLLPVKYRTKPIKCLEMRAKIKS